MMHAFLHWKMLENDVEIATICHVVWMIAECFEFKSIELNKKSGNFFKDFQENCGNFGHS